MTQSDVRRLRRAVQGVGGEGERAQRAELERARACNLDRPRVLIDYHDALLFLLAYPGSAATHRAAGRELERVANAAYQLVSGPGGATSLAGTGIAWSTQDAAFTFEIARWLLRRHSGCAEVVSVDVGAPLLTEVLALALTPMDAELLAIASRPIALLTELAGDRSRLAFLVSHLERVRAATAVIEHLYASLEPTLRITPKRSTLSRTFSRGLAGSPFVHIAPLERSPTRPRALITAPLPRPVALGRAQQRRLVDSARSTLTALGRETDPFTWPSLDAVTAYELERGAAVVLIPMHPTRRFALDSHTGYLLTKNGVPIGYGGGWPFLRVCRHGVNVFPAFRGGESSWLYAQVLRVYHAHFGVARFVIEPYQFGAGNREGLASGAFWFYWRLGFRPADAKLAALGRAEADRMRRRADYRAPIATMRALAGSDLALDCAPSRPVDRVEASDLALAASRWIARHHGGDRRAATRAATTRMEEALGIRDSRRWPSAQRAAFASLSLVFARIGDLDHWSAGERAALVTIMRAKGDADDATYFRALAAHPRLATSLAEVARAH